MVTHVVSNSSKPQIKMCSSNESITVENNYFSKTLFNGKPFLKLRDAGILCNGWNLEPPQI